MADSKDFDLELVLHDMQVKTLDALSMLEYFEVSDELKLEGKHLLGRVNCWCLQVRQEVEDATK